MTKLHAQTPVRTTAPDVTPVTLAQVKADLRVLHSDEDEMIESLMSAAIDHLDGWGGILGRCLITQTWTQDFPDFPLGDVLRLPFPDVQSVTVAYIDDAGQSQTLSADSYRLTNDALGGAIVLDDDATWPTTDDRPDAVTVTMVCGYGDAPENVPDSIRTAIRLHVRGLYDGDDDMEETARYMALIEKHRRIG